ncbi:MAG: fibronectin type III domain-containing protein [Vicinamibacterales bacterium]
MADYTVRFVSTPGAARAALLIALLATTGVPARADAQSAVGHRATSGEAAPGLPAALQSAPDDPSVAPGRDATWDLLAAAPVLHDWRISGSALKPRENDVSYTVNSTGGCTYVTAGDASTVWNAVPNLPDGAVVNTLRMYSYDTSGSNSSAWLTVYDLYGGFVQEFNVTSSGNTGNGFTDSATINHTVDYSVYSYLLNWRPVVTGSTMQLCGFRVFYTIPLLVPGPPLNLSASASSGTVTISWAPPSSGGDADSYVLEAGSAPGLANLAVVPVTATSFSAAGVPHGSFYLRVRGVNATGTGPASAEVHLVVP